MGCSNQLRRLLSVSLGIASLLLAACSTLRPAPAPCYQSKWLDKYVCEPPVISKVPYASLKQAVTEYFDKKKEEGVLIEAGMYFRDLKDGPHFGVNEYASFAAASLLKLPVVIHYLSLAEEEPELLEQKLVVPDKMDFLYNVNYPPAQKMAPGEAHTVDDLMYRTIVYSDNVAFLMLRQHLVDRFGNDSFIWESYRQLGLVPNVADHNYVISVARYASLFKVIYSASFLNPRMSDKLLHMMLEPTFDVGLEAGLPPEIPVADKFGEMERDGVAQLHDCGIVYYPDNPYVLCVMTRGHVQTDLEHVLADVSRMVYQEVDSRRLRRR